MRNLAPLNLSNLAASPVHCLTGPNGAGKSSVLECFWILGRLRSLRGQSIQTAIRHEAPFLDIRCETERPEERTFSFRLGRDGTREYKIDGESVRSSELQRLFPVVAFQPTDLRLCIESPETRRTELQRTSFYSNVHFFDTFQQYTRILDQRNAILKQPRFDRQSLAIWDTKLIEWGAKLEHMLVVEAGELLRGMIPRFSSIFPGLHVQGIIKGITNYEVGKSSVPDLATVESQFAESLRNHFEKDRRRGYTGVGPHRIDWQVSIDGGNLKDVASVGQLRGASLAVRIAQLERIEASLGFQPMVLLDDVFGDLDQDRQLRVVTEFGDRYEQMWISSAHPPDLRASFWSVLDGNVVPATA